MRVLFIAGQMRSGSTLLERLVGELPGVCSLGEVALAWGRVQREDVRCGCGRWFTTCEFWRNVGERAFGGWENVDLDRIAALWRRVGRIRHAIRRIGPWLPDHHIDQIAEYTDYYARLYAATAETAGARVVVDASKYPGLALCLRWSSIDLRVVHLVRDPRGVAYSLTKRVPNPDRDGALQGRMSPLASAVRWSGTNAATELLSVVGRRAGRSPARRTSIYRLRYEDLVADPVRTVWAVANFAGLNLPEGSCSHLRAQQANLGVIHSVAGNRMRFVRGPISLDRDDAWRAALPRRQRALVGALCLPMMMAYGYLPRAAPWAGGGRRQESP